jgi:hypothetical protein
VKDVFSPGAIRVGATFVVIFACFLDLSTPRDQNTTAVLIGIEGVLLFILAELRALSTRVQP